MVYRRSKLIINLTIELSLTGMDEGYNFGGKLNEIVNKMRDEDQEVQLVRDEGEIKEIEALSATEFLKEFAVRYYTKRNSMTMKVSVLSAKTLGNLKHENGGRFVVWLKKENIKIELNNWKKEPYTSIGFFIRRHPTNTNKGDMEREIGEAIRTTLENRKGLARKGSIGQEDVPKILLYHGRKSFGAWASRVTAKVLHVQCREGDARELKHMLAGANGQYPGQMIYIPAGLHLDAGPKQLILALNTHNKYVNERKIVPIVGFSEEMMNTEVAWSGKSQPVSKHLK